MPCCQMFMISQNSLCYKVETRIFYGNKKQKDLERLSSACHRESLYGVKGKKKVTHTSFMSLSKTNDDVPEWTFPAQICEWGKFGFSSCSWLLGQTIWRTYDSLLLFLRCYPWQQVGEENIHHRLSLKQPSQGADWSSWRKKCFWPTSPVKCTPITQWKQEEEQMEGLPLPHTSKCNLYLFPFLILTPSPVGCCLATLPPCSTAALHFFSPPSALTAALGLGRGMTACAPSSLQAEILPLHQHSKTGRSCTRRKMRVQRTLHFLRHGELCSSCFLLHTDSGQGGYWLPIIQFFCLCGCHSVQATGILGR